MRFLVDAQLPPALARLLQSEGHIAEHVTDIGPGDFSDSVIWDYALAHGAVIVTKDEDFPERQRHATSVSVVLWIRVGNTTKAALLSWFAPLIGEVVRRIEAGDRLVEMRRMRQYD